MTGPQASPGRGWKLLWGAVLLVALGGSLFLLVPGIALETKVAVNAVTYPVSSLGAGLLFVLVGARRAARGRIGWLCFGAGVVVWGVGEVIWQWYSLAGRAVPYPGVADAFYLAGYPLMLTGVLLMPHVRPGRYERLRLSLDASAGTVALAGVAWTLYLGDLMAFDPEASFLENAVNALYPVGDLVLLVAVMILVLRRSEYRLDGRLILVGTGLMLTTVADLVYLLQVDGGTYQDGAALDSLWLLSYAALIGGAWLAGHPLRAHEVSYRPPRLWQLVAPYSAVAALYAITLSRMSGPEAFLSWASTLVAVLIILRQAVAIRESRELVEKQRDDLVASVSHELRTPLTAVQGYAQLLSSSWDMLDEGQRCEMVSTIEGQATHLGRIVTDLIDVARDRLNDTRLTRSRVSLEEMVRSAVAGVGTAAARVVAIEVVDGDVVADVDRLRQVIVNLVTNAVRYGRGRVVVRGAVAAGAATLEVHDDGTGVPKKYEGMVWERFERGAHRFDAHIPGSGIGLPVARALVEAHGGTIRYERSQVLGGACFAFTIPAPGKEAPGMPQPRPAVTGA